MITHRYLFFAEQGQIRVYNYEVEDKSFEALTNQGEKIFSIKSDFWKWWIEAASFNSEKNEVDFCFICDREYEELNKFDFNLSSDTVWKSGVVERFFKTYIKHNNIKLINENTEKIYNEEDQMFSTNGDKIFYTNIQLKEMNKKICKSNEEDRNYLATYFIKKMNREKKAI